MSKKDNDLVVPPTGGHFENPVDAKLRADLERQSGGDRDKMEAWLDSDDDAPLTAGTTTGDPEDTDGADENDDGNAADLQAQADEQARLQAEADAAAAAEAAAVAAAGQQDPAVVQAPAPAPAPAPAAAPARLPMFRTRSAEELQAATEAAHQKKAEAFQACMDGSMTPADYAKAEAEAMSVLLAVAGEVALLNANQQTQQAVARSAIDTVKAEAKSQGLDYSQDKDAMALFNAQVDALANVPSMQALSDEDFFRKAHSMVLALRGIAPAVAAPAPAPAPGQAPVRKTPAAPPSLRNVPAAATPQTGGGLNEELSRLQGMDFQQRIGQMPKQQLEAWMDS